MKARGMFEVPPKGYRGSLRGTSWDVDAMNADVFADDGKSFNEGAQ